VAATGDMSALLLDYSNTQNTKSQTAELYTAMSFILSSVKTSD